MWAILIIQLGGSPSPVSPPHFLRCFEFFHSVLECQRPNQCRNFLRLIFVSNCCWHHSMFCLLVRMASLLWARKCETGHKFALSKVWDPSFFDLTGISNILFLFSRDQQRHDKDFNLIVSVALIYHPSPFHWVAVIDGGPVPYLPSTEVSVKAGHVKKKRYSQEINQE